MTRHIMFPTWAVPVIAALGIWSVLGWSGCSKEASSGTVQIRLTERVGSQDVVFDSLMYQAQAGHTYSVITLKYYISRIQLVADNGSTLDLGDVLYRDARDNGSGVLTVKDVPNGMYSGLRFIFGLDSVMNVDGGLENTVENINMEWPIPGDQGYHYMKFEGKYDVYNSGTHGSFNVHLGATSGNQNFFSVVIPMLSCNVDGNDWEITVMMDVNEWLENPNTYDFEAFGLAIMTNQTAQETLKENGSTVFSLLSINRLN